jgi:Ser/Thr protein kinase RdoA (MazF antagonist)
LFSQARKFDPREILVKYSVPYRADPAQITRFAPGFSGALVWRIETPAGPCALRAMDDASVNRTRLLGLHRLVVHVHSRGLIQVPVPIAGINGATVFPSSGFLWQLEPWMPGSADFADRPSKVRLRAALTTLARWHCAAADFVANDAEHAWFFSLPAGRSPGLTERSAAIARWSGPDGELVCERLDGLPWREFADLGHEVLDNYRRAIPCVIGPLKFGLDSPVPLQPCLRDVWHDHVLFTGDNVTGLIDPHSARSDSVATDLARLLGSLVGDDRPRWQVGLDAYQEVRPLSAAERTLVELFDQTTVLLSGMTWLDWHCLLGRVFENREKVIERLKGIVARLRVLASR